VHRLACLLQHAGGSVQGAYLLGLGFLCRAFGPAFRLRVSYGFGACSLTFLARSGVHRNGWVAPRLAPCLRDVREFLGRLGVKLRFTGGFGRGLLLDRMRRGRTSSWP